MITTSCTSCNRDLMLLNYRLVQIEDCIVVREYFSRCVFGNIVTMEDYLEEDQVYLESSEPHRHFPRTRKIDKD